MKKVVYTGNTIELERDQALQEVQDQKAIAEHALYDWKAATQWEGQVKIKWDQARNEISQVQHKRNQAQKEWDQVQKEQDQVQKEQDQAQNRLQKQDFEYQRVVLELHKSNEEEINRLKEEHAQSEVSLI